MIGRALLNSWYRFGTPPWVLGPRQELVAAVESGQFRPGRVLDLGCGAGDNAVFLAEHGFEVVGVDYAPAAVDRAKATAAEAGVDATFLPISYFELPDLGTFDAVLDFGSCDDLNDADRERFRDVVLEHLRPGGQMFLWCFSWEPSRTERFAARLMNSGATMPPADVDRLYARDFVIEPLGAEQRDGWPPGFAHYLLTRKGDAP